MTLFLVAVLVLFGGGVLAAATSSFPRVASLVGAGSAVVGGAIGATFAARVLFGSTPDVGTFVLPWRVPAGEIALSCDALSAFFLLPVFVLGGVAAIYGVDYLDAYRDRKSLGVPWAAYCALVASMAIVVAARHAMTFLVAWELMSLSSYVLVVFEHERADVQRAGWVYLIAAHVGMAFLTAAFLGLGAATGTLAIGAHASLAGWPRAAILLLALLGFGLKAGLVPLHVWLPEAHAASPSHVSALMSGVMIKLGVYGIVRMALLVGAPSWFGALLVLAGLATSLVGVALATYQRDLKRVFAYSSVENVGLIVTGLGLAFFGHATGRPMIAALGAAAALLHVWNHAAMKGLSFLGAGAVVHGAHTRDLERLGGLLRRMPIAGALFGLGAIAIAGLPPLNGFASEWLLYRALIRGATHGGPAGSVAFTFAVGAVSIIGALAALAFLRALGTALLGAPRSEAAAHAHEATPAMLASMAALAIACVAGGLAPSFVLRALAPVLAAVAGVDLSDTLSLARSIEPIGWASLAVWGATALVALLLARSWRADVAKGPTWGCGYVAPTARMQYGGRGLAQLVNELMPRALQPKLAIERPSGLFPAPGSLASASDDPVTRDVYEPALSRTADRFARLRWMQQGMVHVYVLYILVAVVAGLAWLSIRNWGIE